MYIQDFYVHMNSVPFLICIIYRMDYCIFPQVRSFNYNNKEIVWFSLTTQFVTIRQHFSWVATAAAYLRPTGRVPACLNPPCPPTGLAVSATFTALVSFCCSSYCALFVIILTDWFLLGLRIFLNVAYLVLHTYIYICQCCLLLNWH